jgi:hypothetical protein
VETGNKNGEGETIYAQNDKTWVPDLRTISSPPLENTSYWTYKKIPTGTVLSDSPLISNGTPRLFSALFVVPWVNQHLHR